jgi:hypothetical protein
LLIGTLALCGPTQAASEALCRPNIAIKKTTFAPAQAQQRIWTAALAVDASRCTVNAGRFEIGFDRIIEYGPDLRFSEWFDWKEGPTEVSYVFGWDEAPTAYWISGVAPCPCRNEPVR